MNQTSPNKPTQKESTSDDVSDRSNAVDGPSRASIARAGNLPSVHRFKNLQGPKDWALRSHMDQLQRSDTESQIQEKHSPRENNPKAELDVSD